ncbi:patatin-like phospholipase family protein [Pseudomonas sp.]|uniref:patatin-like phospholipase family protein n=1 Tax=Pseudomonas sp. TaxID=306 RepID=UPI003D6F4FDB
MNQHKARKTAFVLAGGGSLGAVQVGMLKALNRARITPDFVVGASMGRSTVPTMPLPPTKPASPASSASGWGCAARISSRSQRSAPSCACSAGATT